MTSNSKNQFRFRSWTLGAYSYKEAAGELNVPGSMQTARSAGAQRRLSSGTGEHAGHLIGRQFGGPGDIRNLGLQNPNINTFAPRELHQAFRGSGGSYRKLESHWGDLLKQGYRVRVTVRDMYNRNENRPFARQVRWTEISPGGAAEQKQLNFGNFGSPQRQAANL